MMPPKLSRNSGLAIFSHVNFSTSEPSVLIWPLISPLLKICDIIKNHNIY